MSDLEWDRAWYDAYEEEEDAFYHGISDPIHIPKTAVSKQYANDSGGLYPWIMPNPTPPPPPKCDCGAEFTSFPDHHYSWCSKLKK